MTATSTPSPQQIDSSCRLPLFVLFGGAAVWLALSSVFGFAASMTFHKPAMFADCALFTYGRAYPAWSNLLAYGFCIPTGLGVGLWLLARLGRAEISQPWLIAVGAKLWHFGVLAGLVGILTGGSTGHEWLEMPRYAAVILFFAFLLITIRAFILHHRRNERALYPSQWFVLAALFWFPWIFSTATLLLRFFPVRGMAQAAVAWWFSGNLLVVWLGLMGLAATFYFLPKILERPLQSRYLALFVFLTLILFGTWTGIPAGVALPAWMPALSGSAKGLMLVPALAVVTILVLTSRGPKVACGGGSLCFTKFGVWSFALAGLLLAMTVCPDFSRIVKFTWFNHGQTTLQIFGFFAMTMFGAVYYILPLIVGKEMCPRRVRGHFWLAMPGAVLFALPLVAGGIMQGSKWLDAGVSSVDVAKSSLMPFRVSTIGELLLLLGNLLFLFNIGSVIACWYWTAFKKCRVELTTHLEPAEVKP